MRTLLIIITLVVTSILVPHHSHAQVLKKTKKETAKNVNEKVDESVNKAVKNIGKGLGGLLNKNKKSDSGKEVKVEDNNPETEPAKDPNKPVNAEAPEPKKPELLWSKFDFVPGEKIIFEDNLVGEENGEFPSRWDLVRGSTENAELGSDRVIMFRGGAPEIIPYLKNSDIDYLPEVFTVEFDLYSNNGLIEIYFYDRKNQYVSSGSSPLKIWPTKMSLHPASSNIPDDGSILGKWAHISIAYTKGKMKAYIDETRLINIPRLEFDPMGLSIHAYHASDDNPVFVKNFRLAEGGVKYYDRFLQDGKIVSNGIRFDTGKSSLKPESMGVINEIYKMLSDHPEINISIEGHTDNVGDDAFNLSLSEERARTVLTNLTMMGIDAERLSAKGQGETSPVSPNDTPEGKAENRRVEFVKVDSNN